MIAKIVSIEHVQLKHMLCTLGKYECKGRLNIELFLLRAFEARSSSPGILFF